MKVSGLFHAPVASLPWKNPGEWAPDTAWTVLGKKKKSRASAGIQTPDRSARSLVTILTELPWDKINYINDSTHQD